MTLGSSIFLIAIGAIMRYAVTAKADGFSIHTAGTILMLVGALGLIISLFWMAAATRRRDTVAVRERDAY